MAPLPGGHRERRRGGERPVLADTSPVSFGLFFQFAELSGLEGGPNHTESISKVTLEELRSHEEPQMVSVKWGEDAFTSS